MAATYFTRLIDDELVGWRRSANRKPLILRGARQTGKSSSIRQLGKSFSCFLEVNFERATDRELARGVKNGDEFLQSLLLRHRLPALPDDTLLFIDEIQECPEAIRWLRFFYEDHPELAVIAAGSLLEVRLQERGFSFPVGRVTFRQLQPMSYTEFAHALDEGLLVSAIRQHLVDLRPLPAPVHARALSLLNDYVLVGGMPEAVSQWSKSRDPEQVRRVHVDLLQAFAEDIPRYRGVREATTIEAAFAALREHYGRRFKYEQFARGFKSQAMRAALDKLEGAMLLRRVWPTSSTAPPLRKKARSAPKLLPLDVGLAAHHMGLGPRDVIDGDRAEVIVGQQLLARHGEVGVPLNFWVTERSKSNAELDYLLAVQGNVVPIEVKAGKAGSLKSLHQFLYKSGMDKAIRFHTGNLAFENLSVGGFDEALGYRLLSCPLYAAEYAVDVFLGL